MANQSTRREGIVTGDTIAAAATAAGKAAIGIIRVSGPEAVAVASNLCGRRLSPRAAEFCRFRTSEGETIDAGIAIYFPAPHSFTGEDVVELQCHGSPIVMDWLLESCFAAGARPAEAGEFSLRAFLNEKLDLTQAEAIADLIDSGSRAQAKAASRSLAGRFADSVGQLQADLTALRVSCESWLDFPDEDIDHAATQALEQQWHALRNGTQTVLDAAVHGQKLSAGVDIAIAGLPNAGKSSLLNRLAGAESAIVTDQPGTTRDTIRQTINLAGIALTLIDMAGLRATDDPVETEGVRRALAEIAAADHVLWVADISAGIEAAQRDVHRLVPAGQPFTLVLNKIDVVEGEPRQFQDEVEVFALSAKTGAGTAELMAYMKHLAGLDTADGGGFSARRRHVEALTQASQHIAAAGPLLNSALELAAEELKQAQQQLDVLTGEHTSDELLGEIFSTFCIGK